MKDECVSLPKSKSQLAQLHDDDEDVFATSVIDRYSARPLALQNICLATFAVMYDVIQSSTKTGETQDVNTEEDTQNTENPHACTKMQKLHKCSKTWRKQKGYRIFLSGPGGTGKSHVVHFIQRDMSHFFKHTVKPDDDQPIVLITAPTGSAAFQTGGCAIHSAFLLHDNYKSKPIWEKRSKMQLKLEHMMLSITDEISMVSFKQFQSMNQAMCILKGTTDSSWGDMCTCSR